jgi:hypothetical protein
VTAGEARYQVQGAFEDNKNTFQLAQTDTIWGEVTFHLGSIIIKTAASLVRKLYLLNTNLFITQRLRLTSGSWHFITVSFWSLKAKKSLTLCI